MNQLVVLFALVAVAAAAPHIVSPIAPHVVAPVSPLVYSHAVPAVAVSHVVEPTVVNAPAVALSKTVHYAPTPVVTGYTSSVIKPDLGHLATPLHTVTKSAVLAPARAVDTVVPQVTHVQPEVSVKAVPVDVPVHTPYVSEVEVRANPAPVVIPAPVPVVAHAPAVAVAHAPAVAVAHAPVVAHGIAPAVGIAHAPVLRTVVAPGVLPVAHGYGVLPVAHAHGIVPANTIPLVH